MGSVALTTRRCRVLRLLHPSSLRPNYTDRPRRSYYLTYNALSEGDRRDAYYRDKRSKFPPECEREKGKDYSEGARIYNLANPIRYFD